MNKEDIISKMLVDYKQELEALSLEELLAMSKDIAQVKQLSDKEWKKLFKG